MTNSNDYIDYIFDQLSQLNAIRRKRMFGGLGVYRDDLFFAIISDNVLYFKTDQNNRPDFISYNMTPFEYRSKGKTVKLDYYPVPDEIIEDADLFQAWAVKACNAAREQEQMQALSQLANIGKTLAQKLNVIGIYDKTQLAHIGAVEAYKKLQAHSHKTLPVCYYLYSLEGALRDCHWSKLSEQIKDRLYLQAKGQTRKP